MSIEEKRREAFEAWMKHRHPGIEWIIDRSEEDPDTYRNPGVESHWESWNAALDSVVIELPEPWTEAFMKSESMLQDCKFAIESAGLKVKQ